MTTNQPANQTIWKFLLLLTDSQSLSMPENAQLLSVQLQDGAICLWALVNPDLPVESRTFEIHGTGKPIHCDTGILRRYIGTVQQRPFVWHVFERL